jgi:hypothetical protein
VWVNLPPRLIEPALSALRALLLFGGALLVLSILFWLFQPTFRHAAPIAATGGETTLVVEGGKEFSSIVAMLTTLTTGLFVLVALVAPAPLRAGKPASAGQFFLLSVFGLCTSGSFYAAMHAKYAIADGLLAKSLDLTLVGNEIGLQAWFVAFSGAAAIALIIEGLIAAQKVEQPGK